jgi:hypothetical protein
VEKPIKQTKIQNYVLNVKKNNFNTNFLLDLIWYGEVIHKTDG